ncbi:N-acetylmuramoyl-L-alanine amidase [Ancylobacter sp. MQZ15Z-1]|uniref:N-acetylmuramoyl-L-alanine amidase n=1 Tax=Ancylobacter mangrovi TaxID=2972472 RepID=A0A9X2PA15_9HYPH|nr:N-acetylmuramoyl-L-alanine amidase [Ancylobacter mangrovi]MCS0493579.1 N-acetylmuramoyl-L-alanine amidase [Ancylobacter mangrovi]
MPAHAGAASKPGAKASAPIAASQGTTAEAASTADANASDKTAPEASSPATTGAVDPTTTGTVTGAVPKAVVDSAPAIATDARLAGDGERTRLVVDLSRSVPLGAFTLADPYRVVVDVPDVVFTLPASAGQEGRGLVTAYRFGLFAPGKARIVMDVSAPVKIDKAFVLEPMDGQPARLVVDLVKTDRKSFLKMVAAPVRRMQEPPMPAPAVAAAGDTRPVIVIDPGHGGIDPGTVSVSSGVAEKELVLAVGLELRDKLNATGRYRVLMTREDDTYVPLGQRVRVARESSARLFISLHADSLPGHSGDARGGTIYTLSDRASDAEAQRLADSENKADMISGVDLSEEPNDVAGILFDLAQRETRNFSAQFARTLAGYIEDTARLHKSPLKSAGFKVLKAPDVPSVLFELGYLSSAKDLELMTSKDWQSKVTDAMVVAINAYFATQKPAQVLPVAMPASLDATVGDSGGGSRPEAAIRP